MLIEHEAFMARQLIDSKLATTREFWRAKLGLPEAICKDPRPLAEIAKIEIVINERSDNGQVV